jgi:UDP-glucose 4-epimerase
MEGAFGGKRIVVTGGAGFVGSNLVHALIAGGAASVLVVDNLLSAERFNLPTDARVTLLEASCADDASLDAIPRDTQLVFHLSTYHGNQSSIADPLADHANNLLPNLRVFDRLARGNYPELERVVYAAAGCTVAEKTDAAAQATTETDTISLWLDSPYQVSKTVGELYANYYFARHRLPVVRARFQNVYGPREVLGAGRWRGTPATVWRNVTPTFIYRALRGRPLHLENGGTATRDFIYVDDVVAGLMLCATQGAPGEAYNIASGVETSIRDLASLIHRLTESTSPLEATAARAWDRSMKRFGEPTKSRTRLGFAATVNLEEGLTATIAWTRANIDRIDACIERHRAFLDIEP